MKSSGILHGNEDISSKWLFAALIYFNIVEKKIYNLGKSLKGKEFKMNLNHMNQRKREAQTNKQSDNLNG